jgi:hypothetical protein
LQRVAASGARDIKALTVAPHLEMELISLDEQSNPDPGMRSCVLYDVLDRLHATPQY